MAGDSHNPLSHVLDHPTIEIPWWTKTYELVIELRDRSAASRSRGSW